MGLRESYSPVSTSKSGHLAPSCHPSLYPDSFAVMFSARPPGTGLRSQAFRRWREKDGYGVSSRGGDAAPQGLVSKWVLEKELRA